MPPPTVHSAIQQCVGMQEALLNVSRVAAMPPAFNHRASAVEKQKTARLYDAGLIIIEPNAREPSQSLPWSVALTKETSTGAGPSICFVLLQQVHSSLEIFCSCRR